MKLDAWDKKILTLLQRNNRLSQREIADRISLSPSAVNRRIAALEDAGVIKGSVSLVDASKVGRPITIMVQVTIENERLDLLEEDKQRFVTCPQVQQVYYVTGDFDFLLVINVRDMAENEAPTRLLLFFSGEIKFFPPTLLRSKGAGGMTVIIE
ncbi:Lrp/AsnC family transcriptional regulator [Klebsiella pneumoniae]|nr:Lrp/AsnC family transcriptional regulator [Klebsiella pneumoniae]